MEQPEEEKLVTSEQIPDDPLLMPPPYWRGSGAVFHVVEALESMLRLLNELIPLHEKTEWQLDEYFEKHPDNAGDEDLEEFSEICDELWRLEHKIRLKTEAAILMSAIQAEDDINRFCVFNIHKDIAESIEKLSPPEKLLIATAVVGKLSAKGDAVYDAIKRLTSWRNAFAHGHCVDRPVKSLRHNHLIKPASYPGVPVSITKMEELLNGYLRLEDYLKSISLNPYTAGGSFDVEEVRESLKEISRYTFYTDGSSDKVYSISYDAP